MKLRSLAVTLAVGLGCDSSATSFAVPAVDASAAAADGATGSGGTNVDSGRSDAGAGTFCEHFDDPTIDRVKSRWTGFEESGGKLDLTENGVTGRALRSTLLGATAAPIHARLTFDIPTRHHTDNPPIDGSVVELRFAVRLSLEDVVAQALFSVDLLSSVTGNVPDFINLKVNTGQTLLYGARGSVIAMQQVIADEKWHTVVIQFHHVATTIRVDERDVVTAPGHTWPMGSARFHIGLSTPAGTAAKTDYDDVCISYR